MTDPIATLAAGDPARDARPTPDEAGRMDAALHRLLAAEQAPAAVPLAAGAGSSPRAASRLRRVRRRWALAPVALATGALALGVALPSSSPRVLQPAPANAATVLAGLQAKVAQAPAEPGRYAYLKQVAYVSHMREGYVVVLPHEYEQWVADDGTGVVRMVVHEDRPTFPTPEDAAAYAKDDRRMPPWDARPRRQAEFQLLGLTAAQIRALPTDPAALRARLEGGDVALTAKAGALLSFAGTPQRVKVALFAVLRDLPGARLVPTVTDPLGRTGVGVEFDDAAWRTLFLFDPGSGALLGTRSIGKKEVPGRTIDDWNLTVRSGRTDVAPDAVR